jgi:hypothetical protein
LSLSFHHLHPFHIPFDTVPLQARHLAEFSL